jgi:hypothetical protein
MGVAIIVPTAISPLDFARQTVWRTLVLGRLACIWIHRQINTLYQQGLHSCNFFAQSLTVHFWLIRSPNQGASYGWDPGPPVWDPGTLDSMGTAKADPQTILSSDVNRNYKQSKVAVSSTEANIPTQIPIQHYNSGKVKTVSIEGDQIRRPCPALNTILENGSLINTHTSSNNIMNHGSNMIINTEVNSSSPQHYIAGTTLDQSRQYHRPGIYLHWIQRHGKRGATSYKWAVSTNIDQLRPGPSSSSSHSVQGHE